MQSNYKRYLKKVSLAELETEVPIDCMLDMLDEAVTISVKEKDGLIYGCTYTDDSNSNGVQKIFGHIKLIDFFERILPHLDNYVEVKIGHGVFRSAGDLKRMLLISRGIGVRG